MKIIDIGMCVDNVDPKGIGRIRISPYGLLRSPIEMSMPYEAWGKNDQFIAIPFLPLQMNIIPQIGQSVKIIKYDTDKDTQNVEYIAGPFSNPHNFGSEVFTTQHKNTTYGGAVVTDLPDIRSKDGKYKNKQSEGALSRLNDTAFYGNYGSDLVFTENGVVLRGGKLIDKMSANKKLSNKLLEIPLLSDKMAKLTLKKFPKQMSVKEENEPIEEIVVSKLKYIVEYSLDNLLLPTALSIFVYSINDSGLYGSDSIIFNTNVFGVASEFDFTNNKIVKLINTDNTLTTPTKVITINSINAAASELREFLYKIDIGNLSDIESQYPKEDIHPFFFRPTIEFNALKPTNAIAGSFKDSFLNNVYVRKVGKDSGGNGLIFSREQPDAPIISKPNYVKKLTVVENGGEQTFSSLSSDVVYILSTNAENPSELKSINFGDTDPYEYTQEDYLTKINPYTYSVVRGDVLIKLLRLFYEILNNHVHNINKPAIYETGIENELREMINNMHKNLVNNTIRIN